MRRSLPLAGYLLLAVFLMVVAAGSYVQTVDWRTASREPVGLAPDPATTLEPVIQVYAARALGWKGLFGVHTWIAVKPAGRGYMVYEVMGWRLYSSNSALVIRNRAPDGRWFGAMPELLAERRGAAAAPLIERIERAAQAY